jgi:hypothetical protein
MAVRVLHASTVHARARLAAWPSSAASPQHRAFRVSVAAALRLNDPSLLRDRCYVNGQWVAAKDGRTLAVHNPGARGSSSQAPQPPRQGTAAHAPSGLRCAGAGC